MFTEMNFGRRPSRCWRGQRCLSFIQFPDVHPRTSKYRSYLRTRLNNERESLFCTKAKGPVWIVQSCQLQPVAREVRWDGRYLTFSPRRPILAEGPANLGLRPKAPEDLGIPKGYFRKSSVIQVYKLKIGRIWALRADGWGFRPKAQEGTKSFL